MPRIVMKMHENENACILADLKVHNFKLFRGSMPQDPPRWLPRFARLLVPILKRDPGYAPVSSFDSREDGDINEFIQSDAGPVNN